IGASRSKLNPSAASALQAAAPLSDSSRRGVSRVCFRCRLRAAERGTMITETTASLGSGINWDGPRFEGGGVTIQVGHEWPGGMQTTHCTGTYEQSRAVWKEIVAWADAHGVDISHLE